MENTTIRDAFKALEDINDDSVSVKKEIKTKSIKTLKENKKESKKINEELDSNLVNKIENFVEKNTDETDTYIDEVPTGVMIQVYSRAAEYNLYEVTGKDLKDAYDKLIKTILNDLNTVYTYPFPDGMTDKDIKMAAEYNLDYLGKQKLDYKTFDEDEYDYYIRGKLKDLRKYSKDYLDYEIHPAYLYDDSGINDLELEEFKGAYKEGAEGKKTPGCKWVAFDNKTDKIILVRSTYTEIQNAINNYVKSHKDSELTPESVKEEDAIRGKDIKDCKFCNESKTLTEKPDIHGVATDTELDDTEKQERDAFEKELQSRRDEFEKGIKSRRDSVSKKREENKRLDEIKSQLNKGMTFDDLFDTLVPSSGKCETLAGELIRAINKVDYRWYNDGDRFFEDYGLETCGSAAAFIDKTLSDLDIEDENNRNTASEPMYEIAFDNLDNDAYENAIENIKSYLVKLILNDLDTFIVMNNKDMLDIDGEDYWKDMNVIPEYEVECDLPDDILAHLEKGNISERDIKYEVESFTGSYYEYEDIQITSYGVRVTGLRKDTYDELEDNIYGWLEDYAEQLNDEYGDPYEEDDEEESEEENESLTESKVVDVKDEEEVKKGKEFLNKSEDETIEQVVDVDADTIDKLKDSYMGNAILQCDICKTLIYKKPEDLVKDETSQDSEEQLYNIEDVCPHCGGKGGYSLIGQVSALDVEAEEPESTTGAPDSVEIGDSEEDIDTTEISDEDNFKRPDLIQEEGLVEELDENKFDKLVNQYIHSIYENVEDYSTTSGKIIPNNKIIVEGIIKYKSGKQKNTKFILEYKNTSKTGKCRFTALNETFSKSKKAFTFLGTLNKNKLMCESLSYNYNTKTLNEDKLIKGKVTLKEKKSK